MGGKRQRKPASSDKHMNTWIWEWEPSQADVLSSAEFWTWAVYTGVDRLFYSAQQQQKHTTVFIDKKIYESFYPTYFIFFLFNIKEIHWKISVNNDTENK